MNKVFLGGTTANTTWRDELIPLLEVDYYNPVVTIWNHNCVVEENKQKEECNIHLYVINSRMRGIYSIAEMIESSMRGDKKVIISLDDHGFTGAMILSFNEVLKMAARYGASVYRNISIEELAKEINDCTK